MDVAFLTQLASKTNVIPVLAKADTLTPEERAGFKERVLKDLAKLDVKIFPNAFLEELDGDHKYAVS